LRQARVAVGAFSWRGSSRASNWLTPITSCVPSGPAFARAAGWALSPQEDAWIAATALAMDAPLATNNRKDYERIEKLRLLSL
jgi:hypothetical protein